MTRPIDDDLLMVELGRALAPGAVEPGSGAMAALHRALEARAVSTAEEVPGVVVPFVPPTHGSGRWARIHRLRHPVAAAVAIGVLATSGVAAAGVATDDLPGPTRNVAFALGLPVTSPALEAAEESLIQLRTALDGRDAAQVAILSALLRARLAGLSPADRASIEAAADGQLALADRFDQVTAGTGPVGAGSSTTVGGSNGPGPSSGSGAATGTAGGGAASSNGTSSGATGRPSGGVTAAAAGSSTANAGGTTAGAGSTGTTEPGDGSGGGNTPPTTPTTKPTTTPTTIPTTTPGTTPTTEPDDGGNGRD